MGKTRRSYGITKTGGYVNESFAMGFGKNSDKVKAYLKKCIASLGDITLTPSFCYGVAGKIQIKLKLI